MSSPDFSGTAFQNTDVTVTRGTDPRVRNDNADPSGFSLFDRTASDGLLEAVRDTYVREVNRAPKILRENALRNFSVYLNYVDRSPSDAIVFTGEQKITFDSVTRQPTHFELTDPKGLGLRVDDLTITPRLIGRIEHECRHLLTRMGVHLFNVGPNESLIAGLDRHYNPQDRKAYIPLDIKREDCLSTTGLNTPTDFGAIGYSPMAQEALYLAAHSSFQDIHVDQIWKIWELLTTIALEKKRYPFQEEIQRAIYEILQEQADPVLQSPAFQKMKSGNHVVAFQTAIGSGNSVELRAFSVKENLGFGLQQMPQGFQYNDVVLACDDSYAPHSILSFNDHSGSRIPNAQGAGNFKKGSYGTSFAKEAGHITAQLGEHGEKFLEQVGSIVMNTAGLPPIKLLR